MPGYPIMDRQFRSRDSHATHPDLPEPAASQEAAGFSKPRRLRNAADRKAVRRSAGNTPERAEYGDAKEFLRRSPKGDMSDYQRMKAWMAENPDGTVEDWTRLEASRGR